MKECTKCNIEKPLSEFYKDKIYKDGLQYKCKKCCKQQNKKYRQKNKDKIREYSKNYRVENKDKRREYNKQYNKENKDKIREYQNQYKEEIKEYQKQWRRENKEYQKQYQKQYRKQNKDKINELNKNYYKQRRLTDIEFKLHCYLRNRINQAIHTYNFKKEDTSIEELGCSIKEYVLYLESQFTGKMSWDNYGIYWEVDHIHPISKGGSFHYTNTQPLTIEENRKKGNKYLVT